MKLLVIVLCLLSERFLVHASTHQRFYWFDAYAGWTRAHLPGGGVAWVTLFFNMMPLLVLVGLILIVSGGLLFGLVGFVFNLVILHYCLGPTNPFYPVLQSAEGEGMPVAAVAKYFSAVNGELFAPVFWYIVFGALGVLCYRLLALCQRDPAMSPWAVKLTHLMDWLPAKILAFFYLLVGNFQAGLPLYRRLFFAKPEHHDELLSACGMQALNEQGAAASFMPQAETIVEHAIIGFLVILAFFTIMAWL